jgi:pimeloyl-ACP methyl ester carboxylesterase
VDATAIDLPGHGDDTGPLGDLHTDASRVREELDRLHDDIVLVGHSYGGAVITEAGDHPAVAHLVYLAAFPLDTDESCVRAAEPEAAGISHHGRPNLGAGFIEGPGGTVTLDPPVAAMCLYSDCDEDTVNWALARLGPQPRASLEQTPNTVAWRIKPSTYVVCADDMVVHPDLQRLLAARCGAGAQWPTGHSPFLSRPDLVAGLIVELVLGST